MKISIITTAYNRKSCIGSCLRSVLEQTYPDIEFLVIDGGSTDGTQEEIEKYKERLSYYVSERDEGVYYAFNKGIENATGDIIGILNSDDVFYDADTLRKIADAFKYSGADLVYAKGVYVDWEDLSKIRRVYSSRPFRKWYLRFGWIPLHTTIFVRKEVFKKHGLYNCKYAIASDYEISIRWFQNNAIKKFFLNEWVVKMRLGGLSTSAKLQLRKSREDLDIIKIYGLQGFLTLAFKIGRKIPQYVIPQFKGIMNPDQYY